MQKHEHLVLRAHVGIEDALRSLHLPYGWSLPLYERVNRLPRLLRGGPMEDAHEFGHDPVRRRLHELGVHVIGVHVAAHVPDTAVVAVLAIVSIALVAAIAV